MTERLASIISRATPLHERLVPPTSDVSPPASPDAQARLDRWRDLLGGDEELDRRLERIGLDRTDALKLLGSDPASGAQPSWAELIRAAYEESFVREAASMTSAATVAKNKPFASVYGPLLILARTRLLDRLGTRAHWLSSDALTELEETLLQRMMRIGSRAFYADFSMYRACRSPLADLLTGEDTYAAYIRAVISGRIWEVLDTYPVVARLLGCVTEFWLDAISEFIDRLDRDAPALRKITTVGTIRRLQAGLSDPHGQGRGVFLVTFDGGGRIVYKPRPIELDRFFHDLIAWVNDQNNLLPLKAPQVLPMEEYGWIEFVERKDCETQEEVERFYERTGSFLALTYALNGSDFHLENLIASGEHPVLIDMEALLGHQFRIDEPDETTSLQEAAQRSVLRVGLLPMLRFGEGGVTANIGGIGGSLEADRPVEILDFKQLNSGAMRLVRRQVTLASDSINVARLDQEKTEVTPFVDHIVRGFEAMYNILLQNQNEFAGRVARELRKKTVRVIIRNTSLYGAILERSFHPKYLRNGLDHGIELDQLARPFLHSDETPRLWGVVAEEQRALSELDIPLFETPSESKDLPLPDGSKIPNAFEDTAEAETLSRIASLSIVDRDFQSRIIQGAFRANEVREWRTSPMVVRTPTQAVPATPEALIEASARIGDHIRQSALDQTADIPVWFTARYNPDSERYTFEPAGHSIADGLGGFALFFAALEMLQPHKGYGHLARAAARPLMQFVERVERRGVTRLPDPGAGTGLGAVAYALSRVGKMLQEPAFAETAKVAADFLTTDAVHSCPRLDVVSGQAGALLALLAVYEHQDSRLQQMDVQALIEALVTAVEDDRVTQGGLSRGAGGIALALRRALPYAVDSDRVRDAIARADSIAASAVKEAMCVAQTAPLETHAAWAAGPMGLALSQGTDAVIAYAANTNGEAIHCADDTATCGRGAYVEMYLAAADHAKARQVAAQAVARKETGWSGHVELSLYRGLAGIGYQALRASAPDVLPSFLTWS